MTTENSREFVTVSSTSRGNLLDPGLDLTLRPMRYPHFYEYFLRSRGLPNGLASGTNWVFRDESKHMAFAFDVIATVRAEEPELFDDELAAQVKAMMLEAVAAEYHFAKDLLGGLLAI